MACSALQLTGSHLCQGFEDLQAGTGSLLAEAGQVLASHLFPRLQLQGLQALQQSSRLLRSLVDATPEEVLQAAALNSPCVAPFHPALRCGDVRAYLAFQAARQAAWEAGPHTWARSTRPVTGRKVHREEDEDCWHRKGSPRICRSHYGRVPGTASPGHRCVWIECGLASPADLIIPLPAGLLAVREPRFSPDESTVAMLLRSGGSRGAAVTGKTTLVKIMAVSLASRDMCWAEVEGPNPDSSAAFEWAPTINRLCVHLTAPGADLSTAWVYDERLALIARIPGLPSRLQGNLCWSHSGTGLLFRDTHQSMSDGGTWRGCLFPEAPDQACLLPGQVTHFDKIQGGAFLPGTGEVFLVSQTIMENRPPMLTCWALDQRSTSFIELGLLFRGITSWAASVCHVAIGHGKDGWLQLALLQPGPRLEFVRSLKIGHHISGLKLSPDGQHLLLRSLGKLVVVHVASGRKAEVMDLPEGVYDIAWRPGGICVEFAGVYTFISFPGPLGGSNFW